MSEEITIPDEAIIDKIYIIRGQKVMLDKDLAELYGVVTKRLKEQVRRNINRFPESFMFELTEEEHTALRSQFASLKRGRHSKYPPFVFTEHGILMLSSVLNSEAAIKMSVQIIETFVQLRKLANNYEEIMNKIQQMESSYNEQFSEIYEVLQKLLSKPEEKPVTKIGYKK
ncbi:ORF6N domain-containing protein [Aquimarina sp. RZ0]|uniref:ORF6N domain-containing protein n=1 Tax=Aquimarina sp. RZ0 TaxID=2607730 RepID=UPI0011F1DC0F|nr:ORF6N domain-containing protein [Aquimarina sp. RZ0]KAA1242529.1 ORF6N domain-containing protein [Aquimarina sp. RZ0]KAA1242538.1 ORF6N domain-containing protein [Aquimarina sp. RZ0]